MDRRLAAILHADVVGYSRLMEGAETRTFRELKTLFDGVWLPALGRHGGRLVNTAGDAMLVEFGSAVAAVRCAMELQVAMAERNANRPPERHVTLRIGLNIGEVIVDGDNIFGDEVNLAARIQALAEPGTVVVSARVRESVEGKVAFGFDDLGDHSVKNISRPVRVHRVTAGGGVEETILPPRAAPAPPSPATPSVPPRAAGSQTPTVSAPVSRSPSAPAAKPITLPADALEPLVPAAPPPVYEPPPAAYTPPATPQFDAPPGYAPPASPLFGPSPVPPVAPASPLFEPTPATYTPPPSQPVPSSPSQPLYPTSPAAPSPWPAQGGATPQGYFAPPAAGWRLVGADRAGTALDMRLEASLLDHPDGVVFGRLPRYCHLTFDNDSLSRRHARFKAAPGGTLTVEDLGSTNGTAVDGQKIEPFRPVPLREGARLSLGEIKVVVSRG